MEHKDEKLIIERVQTGVRIEKRILKVLKALAEYYDISLGELLVHSHQSY
jgi:predicted DNA-binding ribbon-helix-helix protein